MDTLTIFLICAGIIGLNLYRTRFGLPSSYSLLPFQAGILYRNGRPVRELGPGQHRVFIGREKAILADTRPIQVNVQNRAVALASASAEVRDVKKAIYAAAKYSQI